MNPKFQSKPLSRTENASRLFDIEIAALAKYVAKFGKIVRRYSWQHLVDHEIDVCIGVQVARDCVCAEEGRHNFQQRFLIEASHDPQDFQFVFERQTVARF